MSRSRLDLQAILKDIEGVNDVWFQEDKTKTLNYPVIVYTRDDSFSLYADNLKYIFKKRYTVTVIDRDPDSLIPDLVEQLPLTTFDRSYKASGLNHFVFNLYF